MDSAWPARDRIISVSPQTTKQRFFMTTFQETRMSRYRKRSLAISELVFDSRTGASLVKDRSCIDYRS